MLLGASLGGGSACKSDLSYLAPCLEVRLTWCTQSLRHTPSTADAIASTVCVAWPKPEAHNTLGQGAQRLAGPRQCLKALPHRVSAALLCQAHRGNVSWLVRSPLLAGG